MEVKKLILTDCVRLQLRNIKHFEYEPSKPNQLIIGTNGSGKSSVLRELSPLPGDPNDYLPTGKKEIWIDHRGVSYRLISTFHPKKEHHFWNLDTDTDLNPGGTITTQYEKVQEVFGLTPKIFEMIIGLNEFHLMKPPERKAFLTLCSNTNYDYALAMYQRVKDKIRDVAGALNRDKKRLVTEMAKIMPPEEVSSLKVEVKELHEALNELLEQREPVKRQMHDIEEARRVMDKNIRTVSGRLISLLKTLKPDVTEEMATAGLEEAKSRLRAHAILSTEYYSEHEEVAKVFASLEQTHTQNIASIETDIGALEKRLEEINSRLQLPFRVEGSPEETLGFLEIIREILIPIVEAIPSNEEKQYSRSSLQEALKKLEELELRRQRTGGEIERNKALLDHFASLKNNDATTCPNCQHTWIKDYDPERVFLLTNTNELLSEKFKKLDNTIGSTKLHIDQIHQYFEFYRDYARLVSNWPMFKPLWDYIEEGQYLFTKPRHIESILAQLDSDLNVLKQDAQVHDEIKEKLALVQMTQSNQGHDYETQKQRKLSLEAKIYDNQVALSKAQEAKRVAEQTLADLADLNKMVDTLKVYLKDHDDLAWTAVETIRRTAFNEFIQHLQSILARKETALREVSHQQLIIEDIEEQIRNLEFEDRNLKRIAKELSPTEGLIAEGLFGFMKLFIHQMNHVIKKIWTYPLKVLPCALGDDNRVDLDYKFPMQVEGSTKLRRDVNEGSGAMCEVVNLAFRITAMKCLHLTDYPLYLDEFGAKMDPTHKAATVNLVNTLMSDESFPQLFMISHDHMQYGSLIHTQICVLCDANMNMPKNTIYNEHVMIA